MWWSSLNLVQQIFFCIALIASVFLVVQIVLMLIGLGDGTDVDGSDVDLSGDGDADISVDTDPGLSLFTVKGLTAFFAIGGWVGYTLGDGKAFVAIPVAFLAGLIALVGVAFLLRAIVKIQSNGNINMKDGIGLVGEVYLTIPKKDEGSGKINLTLSERFVEYSAVQEGSEPISTGSKIKVIGIFGDSFIVEKI